MQVQVHFFQHYSFLLLILLAIRMRWPLMLLEAHDAPAFRLLSPDGVLSFLLLLILGSAHPVEPLLHGLAHWILASVHSEHGDIAF